MVHCVVYLSIFNKIYVKNKEIITIIWISYLDFVFKIYSWLYAKLSACLVSTQKMDIKSISIASTCICFYFNNLSIYIMNIPQLDMIICILQCYDNYTTT